MGPRRALVVVLCAASLAVGCSSSPAPSATTIPPASPTGAIEASPSASPATSAPAALPPCDAPAGKSTDISLTVYSQERMVRIHPGTGVVGAVPIVLGLHGYGGFGMEVERVSDLSDAADQHGWIAVYPEGTGHPESWGLYPDGHAADVVFLRELINELIEGGCADPDRILVSGISQGGWLADMVGCELSDLVVGVVSVAGRDFGWPCEPKRPVAFTAVSGVKDDVLPWDGGPMDGPPPITSVDSVDDWLTARTESRGCTRDPAETRLSTNVVVFTWSGCAAPVSLYRVEDGGHSWPGSGGFPPVDHELSVNDIIAGMLETATPH